MQKTVDTSIMSVKNIPHFLMTVARFQNKSFTLRRSISLMQSARALASIKSNICAQEIKHFY